MAAGLSAGSSKFGSVLVDWLALQRLKGIELHLGWRRRCSRDYSGGPERSAQAVARTFALATLSYQFSCLFFLTPTNTRCCLPPNFFRPRFELFRHALAKCLFGTGLLAGAGGILGPRGEKHFNGVPLVVVARLRIALVVQPLGEEVFRLEIGGGCAPYASGGLSPSACHARQPSIIHLRMPGHSASSFPARSGSRSPGGIVTVNGTR